MLRYVVVGGVVVVCFVVDVVDGVGVAVCVDAVVVFFADVGAGCDVVHVCVVGCVVVSGYGVRGVVAIVAVDGCVDVVVVAIIVDVGVVVVVCGCGGGCVTGNGVAIVGDGVLYCVRVAGVAGRIVVGVVVVVGYVVDAGVVVGCDVVVGGWVVSNHITLLFDYTLL